MSDRAVTRIVLPLVLAVLAVGVGIVGWQVRLGQQLADGPVPIAWGKEACAHCHMHLSEARFAVQLQTTGGEVLDFDDPGCFFAYVEQQRPEIHEVWFHHAREERWLRLTDVAFVTVAATPMDFGLAAVDASEAASLGYEQARERALAKEHASR
ncbi:MAG: hypothetical protein U0610_06595 [bacterium]